MKHLNKIFVLSGEIVVSDAPVELITILGSCVSVCLWDKDSKIGGMNHYLLPENAKESNRTNSGITATKILIQSVIKKIGSIKNLEARIFGGGNRFLNGFLAVGPQNIEAAKKVLREYGIPIVEDHTGGKNGRKIYFNTLTGDVTVISVE